jgi:hypothetical protein
MESLLTLAIGEYRAVELTLRLTATLTGMTALLLGLCITCAERRFRLPLILSSVSLLGAAWFEVGVWLAWKEAFELAGSSYCVTGHPLAGEDRIIARALAVPALLLSFGMVRLSPGKGGGCPPSGFTLAILLLACALPVSSLAAFCLLGWAAWLLCFKPPATATAPLVPEIRPAIGSIALALFIALLGGWRLLPLGSSADSLLVRSEIIRSAADLLAFVIPSLLLLKGVLKLSDRESSGTR